MFLSGIGFSWWNHSSSESCVRSLSPSCCFCWLAEFSFEFGNFIYQFFPLFVVVVFLLTHHIQLINQLWILLHLLHHFLVLALHYSLIARCHMKKTLLDMHKVSIELIAGGILFLLVPAFELIFFDVVLVYFDELSVPVLRINCLYHHE